MKSEAGIPVAAASVQPTLCDGLAGHWALWLPDNLRRKPSASSDPDGMACFPLTLEAARSQRAHAALRDRSMTLQRPDRFLANLEGGAEATEPLVLQGGDLRHALAGDDVDEFRWDRRGWDIALDILRGLCHIHASNVIHRRAPPPPRRTNPLHDACPRFCGVYVEPG